MSNNSKCVYCEYCNKHTTRQNLKRHENTCELNPKNIRYCLVCVDRIKSRDAKTCSYSCANTYFRSGEQNGNWKQDSYRSTCFLYHKKECVVCGENKIVEVHHMDENRNNNSPENLIPLCPNHHQYWHSRFRHLVEEIVIKYITDWKNK